MQPSTNNELDRDLLEAAVAAATEVRDRAHAPYSRFQVGAAVVDGDGRIFTGCNVENASYGLTVCAERNAVALAVANGSRRLKAVVIVTAAPTPTPPCGACRQVLSEFGPDMLVVSRTVDGQEATYQLSEILPHAFTKSSF